MEQRTRQKQKRMLYDSDDEKIDFNSLTEAEQKRFIRHGLWHKLCVQYCQNRF